MCQNTSGNGTMQGRRKRIEVKNGKKEEAAGMKSGRV